MTALFAKFIINFRWPICIVVLLLTFFLTYQALQITLPEELADIAPKGHPNVQLTAFMNEVFGIGTLVEIGVEVKEGTIFNKETIGKMHRIGVTIYDMRGVIRGQVVSIASHSGVKNTRTYIDEQGLSVLDNQSFRDLSKRAITEPEFMSVYRQTVLNNEAIYGKLVSWDQKSAVIMARFWDASEFKYIFQTLQKVLTEEEDANHKFYLAGRTIEMGYLHRFMKRILSLFGVATVAIVLMLWVAFGTWRGIFMPMWAAFVAVSWGFGSEHLLGWEMDIMTIIVPFMIMAMEVSHCVQILNRFYEEFEKWGDNKKAAEETLAHLVTPGVISIVTDGAGFATLFLIPFKLLQQMAASATYGVVRIFFTTTIFIHAFIAILPAPTEKEMAKIRRRNKVMHAILGKVADIAYGPKRLIIIAVSIVLVIIGAIGLSKVEVGDMQEGSPLFWHDSEYNRAERLINDNFFGVNPYVIHIKGGKSSALADPKLIIDVHNLKNHLEDREDVQGSSAYTEVLKGINMAFHDNDPRWYVLPKDYLMAWQYLDIFRTSGGPDDSKAFFEIDYSEGMLNLYVKDHRGRTIRDIIKDTDQYLEKNQLSEYEFQQPAGLIGVFAGIMDEIKKGQIDALWQISAVLFLLCCIAYRSIVAAVIIIIPLGLGTLITFATMGFQEIGLFIYTVPVAALGMGLGIDYAIYVVSRLKEEYASGIKGEEAYRQTLNNAGKAVFFTATSITIGVITLLLSDIRFQAILGGMLSVVLIANMLGSIFLLPALLAQLNPKFLTSQKGMKI
jgi:predicted RND superfamily exporter protein